MPSKWLEKDKMDRAKFWNKKPELNWPQSRLEFWDRRHCIRAVAEMFEKPRVLEIGVDSADVLLYCHDVFGDYTGVDIKLKDRPKGLKDLDCPFRFVESSSWDFWKSLSKDDVFDLIYVDGDHGDLPSHLDMTQAMLRLSKHGYILVHDVAETSLDHGPGWSFDRTCNLPGWYARKLEGHGEGMAIYFRE
jgi:hypothetical protein